jgi:hypothetical protein
VAAVSYRALLDVMGVKTNFICEGAGEEREMLVHGIV